jgi:hypothetical protein
MLMLAMSALAQAQAHRDPPLERRIAVYTRTLSLDLHQQAQLRGVLIWQKDEMQRVWNDATLTAAMRVHATQIIAAATANRIRAMLNEEQRRKYNPPPQPRDQSTPQPNVESWMNRPEAQQ